MESGLSRPARRRLMLTLDSVWRPTCNGFNPVISTIRSTHQSGARGRDSPHRRLPSNRRRLYAQARIFQHRILCRDREHRFRFPYGPKRSDLPPHGQAEGLSLERLAPCRNRCETDIGLNPITGFSDKFGQLMWSAIADPAHAVAL